MAAAANRDRWLHRRPLPHPAPTKVSGAGRPLRAPSASARYWRPRSRTPPALLSRTATFRRAGPQPQVDSAASFILRSSIAWSTFGGDIGNSVNLIPVAAETAFAIAAKGGTIEVSPTPRTP